MTTEPTPIDTAAAVTLVAAAAGAVSADQAPNAAAWERLVRERADALLRLVPAVVERSAVLASCRPVTGVLLSVRDVSGRAVITIRPTMGSQDDHKTEDFRTDWLNEPAGAAMAALARRLVGRHCRFGKRLESTADGQKKVRMCEWIEDLGADPEAVMPTPTLPPGAPTPPASRPVATGADPEDPFRPFDETDEVLAGPVWARNFESAMLAGGWDRKVVAAVVHYATGGRTRDPKAVLRSEMERVRSTHMALDAGRLGGVHDVDAKGHVNLTEISATAGPGPRGRAA